MSPRSSRRDALPPRRVGFPSFRLAAGALLALVATDVLVQREWPPPRAAAPQTATQSPPQSEQRGARAPASPATPLRMTAVATEADRLRALEELRRWAGDAPDAALAWALRQPGSFRSTAVIAVLEVSAAHPELALRLGRQVTDEPDCTLALAAALVRRDDFAPALECLRSLPADSQASGLTSLFAAWARRDPAAASQLVSLLQAQGVQGAPFAAVMAGWSDAAPAEAAAFSLQLPRGAARRVALETALPRWAEADPEALAASLPQLTDPGERDAATALLVRCTDPVNRPTAVALGWAERISSPALRTEALGHVLREWARQDPAAVLRYLQTDPRLGPGERETLLAGLAPPPPDAL